MNTFFIIAIIFLFLFWFFRDNQPFQTVMLFGKKGSGKTCDIAKRSLKYQKKGYKVYSTVDIPGNHLFDPLDIETYTFEPYSVVFIDEVSLIWSNRDFKNYKKGFDVFFRYARQYKLKVFLYSQAFDIDLKIRNLCDKLYLMQRIGKLTLIRPIYKSIGISQDQNGNGQLVDTYRFGWPFDWRFNYMPRYYGLFRSFNPPNREVIRSVEIAYNDINLIYQNTSKYIIYKFKQSILNLKAKFNKFFTNLKEELISKK